MTARRVVITADDFGLAPGINAGIIEAAAAGSVSAVSVLVNLRDPRETASALQELRGVAPRVAVGLHFNCTVGKPLSRARGLRRAKTGNFFSLPILAGRVLLGLVRASDVASECQAQLDVLKAMGISPTHIDGHLHVHALPVFWDAVTRVARLNLISHVRQPVEPWTMNPSDVGATAKKILLRGSFAVASAKSGGLATRIPNAASDQRVTRFAGMSLRGNSRFAPRLLDFLEKLPPGTTELMVHPGHADPEALLYTGYVEGREAELRALISSAVRERLSRGDIELVPVGS